MNCARSTELLDVFAGVVLMSNVVRRFGSQGTVCDMVTGEEKRHGKSPEEPAKHISITIEMAALEPHCEILLFSSLHLHIMLEC